MATPDIYATAKGNLRDNVKTLIAVFGAIAGVLLAGTPFTGFGALDPSNGRWYLAFVSLVGAVLCVGISVRKLLKVLEPDLVYTGVLRRDFDLQAFPALVRGELEALRKEFGARKGELLRKGHDSIEDLERAADTAWESYSNCIEGKKNAKETGPGEAQRAANGLGCAVERQQYDELSENLTKINHWSAFTCLHYRVRRGSDCVFVLGLGALVFIGMFSWSVSAQKDKPTGSNVVILGDLKPASKGLSDAPAIKPVQFATARWDLSKEAIDIIGTGRDYLRTHPEAGVLVFAYTDTQGGPGVNRRLALKRADAVARSLVAEGGISASRVFVTGLAESDLPVLTGQEVDNGANRTVQLVLIPMPSRK